MQQRLCFRLALSALLGLGMSALAAPAVFAAPAAPNTPATAPATVIRQTGETAMATFNYQQGVCAGQRVACWDHNTHGRDARGANGLGLHHGEQSNDVRKFRGRRVRSSSAVYGPDRGDLPRGHHGSSPGRRS